MKLPSAFIISISLLISSQSFAEKILAPPLSGPECHESYEGAAQPKSANAVLISMQPICERRGGLHVLHKILGNSKQPETVILSCVGDDPTKIIFTCNFSISSYDL